MWLIDQLYIELGSLKRWQVVWRPQRFIKCFVAILENMNFITLVYEQIQSMYINKNIRDFKKVHTIIVSGKGVFINKGKKATVLSGMIIIVLLQFKVII